MCGFFIYNKYGIIGFQSPATPIMEGIIDFHNDIFFFLILVVSFLIWMFTYILTNYFIIPTYFFDVVSNERNRSFFKIFFEKYVLKNVFLKSFFLGNAAIHTSDQIFSLVKDKSTDKFSEILETREVEYSTKLELIWTIIPSFILVSIAVPSFSLLYQMEEIVSTRLTVKVIGYQWFWTYEYTYPHMDYLLLDYFTDAYGYNLKVFKNQEVKVFDSVMLPETELSVGYHRLLEVDHQLVLPINEPIRVLVTAADVLHSWAIPSLGIKIDAVPGRLSQVFLFIKREGVFYGQCSELCGVNHGFMPIVIKAVSYFDFSNYNTKVESFWWSDNLDFSYWVDTRENLELS